MTAYFDGAYFSGSYFDIGAPPVPDALLGYQLLRRFSTPYRPMRRGDEEFQALAAELGREVAAAYKDERLRRRRRAEEWLLGLVDDQGAIEGVTP